jgi:radical SAM protein with 4Fe4S-binding SPASM domain
MLSRIVAAALAHRDVLNYQRQNVTFVGDPLDIITTRRCPAGSNLFMIVDTNETIIPCQFMPLQLDFPRIIFRSGDDFSRMKKAMDSLYSDELVANLEGECGECGFKATCGGGCIGGKVTNGLALTAEQPLCIRGILRAVLEQCTRREIDDLTHYWYYHYGQRVGRNDRNRSCMRKLPIWELNFHYSRVSPTDGGPSQPAGM